MIKNFLSIAACIGIFVGPAGLKTYAQNLNTDAAVLAAARARAEILKTRTLNLKVVNLPAGDVGTINIDWFNNGATKLKSSDWLSQGFAGIKFVGQGIDKTHIRGTSWDGMSLAIGRHNGIVRFENLTVHSGFVQGAHFGQQNIAKDNFPGFQIELVNVKGVVDSPFQYFKRNGQFRMTQGGSGYVVGAELTVVGGQFTAPAKFKITSIGSNGVATAIQLLSSGSYVTGPTFGIGGSATISNGSGSGCKIELGARPKWLWFGYNADLYMNGVFSNSKQAVEHSVYMHGFAKDGATVLNSTFWASGAEGFKVRSDSTETRWAGPNQIIYIADSTFRNWYQLWSWRGGAGLVVQGSGAHIVGERLAFHGGGALNGGGFYPNVDSNSRSMAIGLSSEGVSYDQATGVIGSGYGNGFVHLEKIAAYGASLQDWRNNLIRLAKNGGSQKSARGIIMDQMSLWGPKMFVTVGDVDPGTGRLQNSNTPALKAYAESIGMNTSVEAVVPRYPLVPVSQGAVW